MKISNTVKLLVALLVITNFKYLKAQNFIEGNNSILWQITGNDLKGPSYIYGLGDNMCKEDIIFNDVVVNAIKNTEQVVFDSDISPEAQIKQRQLLTQKNNVSDSFSEKDRTLLNEFYITNYGADMSQLGFYKPFVLELLIKNKWSACKSPYDIRTDIVKIAEENKLNVAALESPEDQVAIFDNVPEEDFVKSISKIINDRTEFEKISKKAYEFYKAQNQDSLVKILKEIDFIGSNLERTAVKERHSKWLPKIEELIKGKPSFIAIGNAHILPLGYDLVSLLKKKGYVLKAIKI